MTIKEQIREFLSRKSQAPTVICRVTVFSAPPRPEQKRSRSNCSVILRQF